MVSLPIAYMDDLVVDEAFRHRGIARALFQASERRAKALGAQRLDLMVWSFNENARQFYAAQGMTPQRYIYEKAL
jgi:ribosomal protein S18 acetylase RimI-like enzyme